MPVKWLVRPKKNFEDRFDGTRLEILNMNVGIKKAREKGNLDQRATRMETSARYGGEQEGVTPLTKAQRRTARRVRKHTTTPPAEDDDEDQVPAVQQQKERPKRVRKPSYRLDPNVWLLK
jgi:hypothetical protein